MPELQNILNHLFRMICILFVEDEVDVSKMFKTVKQIGRVVEFAVQDEKHDALGAWYHETEGNRSPGEIWSIFCRKPVRI